MLAKKYRLGKKEIERLYKKGKVIYHDFFIFRVMPNRAQHPRFAVVIPKKTAAKATERNSLKRKIYSLIETLAWQNFPATDCAIMIKAPMKDDLETALKDGFKKCGLENL